MNKLILVAILCVSGALASTSFNSWRIVGGQEAEKGTFKYQISLRSSNSHSCGGSILDATTIICAAHCVSGAQPNFLTVVTGSQSLSSGGYTYGVAEIRSHVDYNPFQLYNDISILKLKEPINFERDNAEPIQMRKTYVEGGEDLVLSGWGTTSFPGSIPDKLQYINLRSISHEDCKSKHSNPQVFETEICTLTKKGEGACHGDSGGPLADSNGEQVGIVSWGSPCARGLPDVFTRVSSFIDWIEANRK